MEKSAHYVTLRVFRVTGTKPRTEDSAVPFKERGTSDFT
jgi:hypothetical protein